MRLNNRKTTQRGSSLVESALVLLTFLLMVIGAIDFAQVIYFQQSLVERARAALRYAVTVDPSAKTTEIKNMAVYNTTTPGVGATAILSGLTTGMVSVATSGSNTTEALVVVTISGFPMRFYSPYIYQGFTNQSISVAGTAETLVP